MPDLRLHRPSYRGIPARIAPMLVPDVEGGHVTMTTFVHALDSRHPGRTQTQTLSIHMTPDEAAQLAQDLRSAVAKASTPPATGRGPRPSPDRDQAPLILNPRK